MVGARPALYVAGVDAAGADEGVAGLDGREALAHPQRDATVVTIAEVERDEQMPGFVSIRLVEHFEWVGLAYQEQYLRLRDVLRGVWPCARVVIDASGIGAGVAAWLQEVLGESLVECFQFTRGSKSTLGWDVLAAVNTGPLEDVRGGWFTREPAFLGGGTAGAQCASARSEANFFCSG